ncbi:MAG: hypothetical protein K0R98_2014, partial [Rickettsiaceae bacterium]|nr:hypothetical protein [Rickettsiaceae bacterium]
MAKARQYQKHNVTTYHKTINEIDEWQGRSFNAKAFHTMLVSYATEGSINSYNAAVTFLEKNRSNTSFLKEVSINGFTHLHDAIHLPFKSEKLPEEKRKEVALSLINLITNYANPEIMAFLLTSRNQEGFSV